MSVSFILLSSLFKSTISMCLWRRTVYHKKKNILKKITIISVSLALPFNHLGIPKVYLGTLWGVWSPRLRTTALESMCLSFTKLFIQIAKKQTYLLKWGPAPAWTQWVIYWLSWPRSNIWSIKHCIIVLDSVWCVWRNASLCKLWTKCWPLRPVYWHYLKDHITLTYETQTSNWTTAPHYVGHRRYETELNYYLYQYTFLFILHYKCNDY